jgi:ABC-2 type transport system ATP-binding protein
VLNSSATFRRSRRTWTVSSSNSTVNSGPASAADAPRRLDGAGVTLAGLSLREPSLDDVFLSLTGHEAAADTGPTSTDATGRRKKDASA